MEMPVLRLCVEPCPVDCIFMGSSHDLSCYSRDGCRVDFSRLPVEIAWGKATLEPLAVAQSKSVLRPCMEDPTSEFQQDAPQATRPSQDFHARRGKRALPLVSAIVSDLVDLSCELVERRERLSLLVGGKANNSHDPYHEELVQVQKDMEKDTVRLREYVEELRALGVEPKSGTEGLVDFRPCLTAQSIPLLETGRITGSLLA